MTLLVIELKLPEPSALHSAEAFAHALVALAPKALAWVLSFFVLALFWMAHHRVFAYLRLADATLVALNLAQLAFVSLMPFASALIGESSPAPTLAQLVYSIDLAMLGLFGWLIVRHVFVHPRLTARPMPKTRYLVACVRIGGMIVISIVAVAITAATHSGLGNLAFMLMAIIMPVSRALEQRAAE